MLPTRPPPRPPALSAELATTTKALPKTARQPTSSHAPFDHGGPGSAKGPGPAKGSAGNGAALYLVQASPDAVRLPDPQSKTEALFAHRARCADGPGLSLARRPRLLAFEVGRCKKDDRRLAATSCASLPILGCG